MEEEVWKEIIGWEGFYQVSNLGRVKSVPRIVVYISGQKRYVKGGILRASQSNGLYKKVSLSENRIFDTAPVHRLVAAAFCEKSSDLQVFVNHKNGDKLDNRASNLEWCTPSENQYHSYRVLKNNPPRTWKGRFGKDHCTSKKVMKIATGDIYDSVTQAAADNGCSFSGVAQVCRGICKTIKGMEFKYI